MPVWWYKVKWQEGMEKRPPDLHVPPIFTPGSEKIMDQFEDPRILCQKAYWDVLKLRDIETTDDINQKLYKVFSQFVTDKDEFDNLIHGLAESDDKFQRDEYRDKLWEVYEDFWNRIKHYYSMHHQSSKLNFDSEMRTLRRDMTKWRYMIVDNEDEYSEFRKSVENPVPPLEMRPKIDMAHKILKEIEKMVRSQR
eukprot:UN25389